MTVSRREFNKTAMAALLFAPPAYLAHAATLERTPSQAEGPYYPVKKPAHPGNNLVQITGDNNRAQGQLLTLSGRVLNQQGQPVNKARVEIWQCDAKGVYDHPRAPNTAQFDPHFQGYGETFTDAQGHYEFLTIVPVPYTGRPPHIHAKVNVKGSKTLTTQLYLKDHPENDRDGLLRALFSGDKDALMIAPKATADNPIQQAGFVFVV